MLTAPDISVCTIAPPGEEAIFALLASVDETADPVSVETVVVVNGPALELASRLDRRFPQTKILENRSPARYGQARNQALRLATGRYLSVWDHDMTLKPHTLLQIALFLDEHPETGIVVPCVEDHAGKVFPTVRSFPGLLSMLGKYSGLASLFSRASNPKKSLTRDSVQQDETEIDWAVGSAMVIRREVLEEIGFFDERYLAAYDDADFCRRAKRAGWHIVYLPAARVCHDKAARYDTARVLDIDPLSPYDAPRTRPEQVFDAIRFLLGVFGASRKNNGAVRKTHFFG